MGATEVDVALGNGSHTKLVERPGEEGGEGAGKHHVTVPRGTADRHANLGRGGRKERGTRIAEVCEKGSKSNVS